MGYEFDKQHIKNEIERLEKNIAFCGNIEKTFHLAATINAYNHLLYLTSTKHKLNVIRDEISKKIMPRPYSFAKESDTFHNAFGYLAVINDFYERVKNINIEREKLSRKIYSEEEILGFTHDFFQKQPPVIFDAFLKAFESKDYALRFTSKFFLQALGETCKMPDSHLSYISLCREKTVESLLISIHEYGHAISNCFNRTSLSDDKYLGEVEAIFWELVGTDFITDSLDLEWQAEMYRRKKFEKYQGKAIGVVHRENIHYLKNCPSAPNVQNQMKNFRVTPDTIKYLISYIVAVDLYYVYLTDPEYAIHLLKNHMSNRDAHINTLNTLKEEGLLTGENLEKEIHRLELKL